MKYKYLLLLVIISIGIKAQKYKIIDTADYVKRQEFYKKVTTDDDLLKKRLKDEYSGKTGREIGRILDEKNKDLKNDFKDRIYTFNSPFEQKVRDIIDNLKKDNPDIPTDLKILIARSNSPNAMMMLDGVLVVNMGVFYWFNEEDEIAAILSHEISHYLKKHSLTSVVKRLEEEKADRTKIDEIKEEQDHRNDKALSLLKSKLYQKNKFNRHQEIEADSLGYAFLEKSKYSPKAFLTGFEIMKKYDSISPQILEKTMYKKYFDLPKQPFNDKWLVMEDFSQYSYKKINEKFNKDSLATHPNIEARIVFLKKTFPEIENSTKKQISIDKEVLAVAQQEFIPNLFYTEEYGVALYDSLLLLQADDQKDYYKFWLGKIFEKLYQARKDYKLNRYLDRIDPNKQSKSYQQYLSFIWNLRLEEMKNIADYYQQKYSNN